MTGNWNMANVSVITDNRPQGDPIQPDDWVYAMEYGGDSIEEFRRCPGDFFHQRLDTQDLVGFDFQFFSADRKDGQPPFLALGKCHPAQESSRGDYYTDTERVLAQAVIRFDLEDPEARKELALELNGIGTDHPDLAIEPAEGLRMSLRARDKALGWILENGIMDMPRTILRAALTGECPKDTPVSLDVREFQKTLALIDAVPEAREGIRILEGASRSWKKLAREWRNIEECVRSECGTVRMPPFWNYEESPSRALIRQTLLHRD